VPTCIFSQLALDNSALVSEFFTTDVFRERNQSRRNNRVLGPSRSQTWTFSESFVKSIYHSGKQRGSAYRGGAEVGADGDGASLSVNERDQPETHAPSPTMVALPVARRNVPPPPSTSSRPALPQAKALWDYNVDSSVSCDDNSN
jgi:hypothetical protein